MLVRSGAAASTVPHSSRSSVSSIHVHLPTRFMVQAPFLVSVCLQYSALFSGVQPYFAAKPGKNRLRSRESCGGGAYFLNAQNLCRGRRLCRPAESRGSTEIFGEFRCTSALDRRGRREAYCKKGRADRVVRPYGVIFRTAAFCRWLRRCRWRGRTWREDPGRSAFSFLRRTRPRRPDRRPS